MNDTFNPVIISSKAASKHLEKVRAEHANILEGLATHQMKVEAYQQQKDMERQQQDMVNREMDQQNKDREATVGQQTADREFAGQQQTADREMGSQKNTMDYSLKQAELEVKKLALTQPE